MVSALQQETAKAADLPAEFRNACRHLAGGVSVITVGSGERRSGLTATAVKSLAIEPPTVIICVNRSSSSWPLLVEHRAFGVNILSAHHKELAERFSGFGGIKGADRYAGAAWSKLVTGVPLLADAIAALDCELEEVIERHSHAIVLGRVVGVITAPNAADANPLIYWRNGMRGLGVTAT